MADVCRPNLTRGDIRSAQNPQPPDDRTYSAKVTSVFRSNLPLHRICAQLFHFTRPLMIIHAATNVKHYLYFFHKFFLLFLLQTENSFCLTQFFYDLQWIRGILPNPRQLISAEIARSYLSVLESKKKPSIAAAVGSKARSVIQEDFFDNTVTDSIKKVNPYPTESGTPAPWLISVGFLL